MAFSGRTTMVSTDRGLQKILDVARSLNLDRHHVRIGFLEDKGGAEIHDPESGMTVAELAEVHEFGTVINMPERQQTIYKSVYTRDILDKEGNVLHSAGEFKQAGKFVKRKRSNFAQTVTVGAHVIVLPERSFLRRTADVDRYRIREAGVRLVKKAVDQIEVGALAEDQIPLMLGKWGAFTEGLVKRTVQKGVPPPNKRSTIRKKRSAKPLVDTGQMVQSIRYGVVKS